MVKYGSGRIHGRRHVLSRPERSILIVFLLIFTVLGGWAVWPHGAPAPADAGPPVLAEVAPVGDGPAGDPAGNPAGEDDAPLGEGEGGADRPRGTPVVVHVAGAVQNPGVHTLREGQRVADAVAAAGGPTPDARVDLVNLAARLEDGQKIHIPSEKDARVAGGVPAAWEGGGIQAQPAKVSLNRAGVAELDTLPGIGPALAQRILDYRRAHGPFRRLEDLQQVPGIGPAKFQEIRGRLTLD